MIDFGNRLKNEESLERLFLYLGSDEQQEFLERAMLLKHAKETYFLEDLKSGMKQEDYDNEEKYNFLLDKCIILSRMSKEDRLGFLLLNNKEQEDYTRLYLKMRSILDSDNDDYNGDNDENLVKYNLFLEKMKSRYSSRSLLKSSLY